MVISGEWWKIKKRYLSLLMDKEIGVEKGRKHERFFFVRLRNKKVMVYPLVKAREPRS
jgi:hypothetical protein